MEILNIIVERYRKVLSNNLVGIYLHGSLAMGCYTNKSDIDFLVVVKEPIDLKTKKDLIQSILYLNDLPEKGVEMSIILEEYAKNFVYPTPFELHYSDFHRDRYLNDSDYICGNGTDKDLAAHLTIIIYRGVCLYGKEIKEVFGGVPPADYIDSIIYDVENAKIDILENPVYIILNLCRVLYYLREKAISSKLEGGNWGKEMLPQQYRSLIVAALKVYKNESHEFKYPKDILMEYADYMISEISRITL